MDKQYCVVYSCHADEDGDLRCRHYIQLVSELRPKEEALFFGTLDECRVKYPCALKISFEESDR